MTKIHLCNSVGFCSLYPEHSFYRLFTYLTHRGFDVSIYDLRIKVFSSLMGAGDSDFVVYYMYLALLKLTGQSEELRGCEFEPKGLEFFVNVIEKEVKNWLKIIEKEKPDIIGLNVAPRGLGFDFSNREIKDVKCLTGMDFLYASYLGSMVSPIVFLYSFPYVDFRDIYKAFKFDPNIKLFIYNDLVPTVMKILSCLERKENISKIENTFFVNDGKLKKNPPMYDTNLEYPYANYSKAPLDLYDKAFEGNMLFSIDGSIGCPLNCSFCDIPYIYGPCRARTPEDIAGELIYYSKNFNQKRFIFNDRVINADIKAFERLCDILIKEGFCGELSGYINPSNELTYDLLKKAYLAGIRTALYGVDSGSLHVLKLMNKNYTVETASRILRESHLVGIKNDVAIITDFPGETDEDFRETLNFVENNSKYISTFRNNQFMPLKGSDVYKNPGKYGINSLSKLKKYKESKRLVTLKNLMGELGF